MGGTKKIGGTSRGSPLYVSYKPCFGVPHNTHLKYSIAAGNTTWVLVDMYMESNLQIPANDSPANIIQSLGKLLYTLFTGNDAPATNHSRDRNNDNPREELVQSSSQQATKTRRAFNHKSLIERLLQSGYPSTSVCRLLNDLMDNPITSLDEIIQDLEQMNAQPHIYLVNPENEFYSTPLNFGQRYYGRSNELAKLLELITTVTNKQQLY